MRTISRFSDRTDAGRALAEVLSKYRDVDGTVLALPRGGVPVAYEIAAGLGWPLDVFVVRKLGVPGHEELAMGAISSGDVMIVNHEVVSQLGITEQQMATAAARERDELTRRERSYRGARTSMSLHDKTAGLPA